MPGEGNPPDEVEIVVGLLLDEIKRTLLAKRADYGTANINATGQYGVAVRLLDKISRLLNLTDPANQTDPNYEAVIDTWRDIAGYGVIGMALEKEGKW